MLYDLQNPQTLDSRKIKPAERESIVDLDLLKHPSRYGKSDRQMMRPVSEEALTQSLALLSASYREIAGPTATGTCIDIALSVQQRIKLDPASMLETVAVEISSAPSCACEIVKAAIRTTGDELTTVTRIVEAAINAAPDQMRLISQCAIAAAPEALAAIQSLMAELDPNGGDSSVSSKSAKSPGAVTDAIRATTPAKLPPNPLDLPPLYLVPPPAIIPPFITDVNP